MVDLLGCGTGAVSHHVSFVAGQGWGRYFEKVSKIRYRYTKGLYLLIQIPLIKLAQHLSKIQKIQIGCIFRYCT